MCLYPSTLNNGLTVGCRICWQCHKERTDDLVGRCIAESHTSTQTLAVTLTYRGDIPNAAVLVYRDVQLLFKRLRADGIKLRYIVAGEYGSQNGRAHWHAVIFLQEGKLDVPFDRNLDWKYWPHGFSFFQKPGVAGIRYIMKYAVKDTIKGEVKKGHLAMSKKPPLGYQYLIDLALLHVEQGVTPRSPDYSFPEAFDRKGRRIKFKMRGRMLEMFLEAFSDAWKLKYGEEPQGQFVQDYWLDATSGARRRVEIAQDKKREKLGGLPYAHQAKPPAPEQKPVDPAFGTRELAEPGEILRLSFGDFEVHMWIAGAIQLYSKEGGQYWHVANVEDGLTALQNHFKVAAEIWNGGPLVPDQDQFTKRLYHVLRWEWLDYQNKE